MRDASAFPLSMATAGQEVEVVAVEGGRGLRRRLTEMGFISGIRITVMRRSVGGPLVVAVGEGRVMLSPGMAHKILVR